MATLLAPQDSLNMAQAQWQEMMSGQWSNGVMLGQLNTYVTTTTSGLGISVASGKAMVQGFLARSDAAVALTAATADPTNPRIDRAVLHADLSAHTLTVILLTGTPNPSPTPPALTQTATVWEISLYQVRVNAASTTITSLTDERTYTVPNNAVNRLGDTMQGLLVLTRLSSDSSGITSDGSGNLTATGSATASSVIFGAGASGSKSFLAYSTVNHENEYWTPQAGGTALGHLFVTWSGAAQVTPFGVGPTGISALAFVDNSGNVNTSAQVFVGAIVSGRQSYILYNSGGNRLEIAPPLAGVAQGVNFAAWDGAAARIPFSVGGQFGGATAWADNSGNMVATASYLYGAGVSGSRSFISYSTVNHENEYWTPQSGATALGHLFVTWNGSAQVTPFGIGSTGVAALAFVDTSGNYNGPIGGGIPTTRNGVATSAVIYTGANTPSSPPTGSIWVNV